MKLPLFISRDGNCIVVRGNAWQLLRDGQFVPYYVGTVHGFMLDAHRLPDLLAYLDSRRIAYRLQGGAA